MKGVIVNCLEELVRTKFGKGKWEEALEMSGIPKNSIFLPSQDIDDRTVMSVVKSVCSILEITINQVADAFGEYWMTGYAPRIYKTYFRGKNTAKEFLLSMDNVHDLTTDNMPNAQPPKFEFEWENDNNLVMKYTSQRSMMDFMVGLIKGVGKYYNEDLEISQLGSNRVRIVFSS